MGSQKNIVYLDKDEVDLSRSGQIVKIFQEYRPNKVINCAAYTQVDQAEEDDELAYLINDRAVDTIAQECQANDVALIHISTDYVFSGAKNTPYSEAERPDARSIYGKSKLAGERKIQDSGCRSIIFRTSWLYSEFQHNFVKTMLNLAESRESLSVVFDQVGTPTYARDLAQMILNLPEWAFEKFRGEVFHYSNEGVASWYDFAHEIFKLKSKQVQLEAVLSNEFPRPAPRPAYSVLDKTKIKKEFGVTIPYWKEALKSCLEKM
jgi:dTDP-4-dehydrorhamnose reductase